MKSSRKKSPKFRGKLLWQNRYVDDCGCHDIFCEFVDYLLKNNLNGYFHFPRIDGVWYKGFNIENIMLSEKQIKTITNYLNRITSQIAVINMYKNDNFGVFEYKDSENISEWIYSSSRVTRDKFPYHNWEFYRNETGFFSNILKPKENRNFNLELFCRHLNMCKILKKYGDNKVAFFCKKTPYDDWYEIWSFYLVISKDIKHFIDQHQEKTLPFKGEKMTISKDNCTLYIPISIEPYI